MPRMAARALAAVACGAALLALEWEPLARGDGVPRIGSPAPAERDGHPRLLLDDGRVGALRARLGTTHRFLWERYEQDLPRMVAVSKREAPLEDARYDGDLVPELAFAGLMTGRDDLLAVAKAQLLRLATDE